MVQLTSIFDVWIARVLVIGHGNRLSHALTPEQPRKRAVGSTQVHVVPDVLPHSFDEFRKTIE
jgi:hypothetical protein